MLSFVTINFRTKILNYDHLCCCMRAHHELSKTGRVLDDYSLENQIMQSMEELRQCKIFKEIFLNNIKHLVMQNILYDATRHHTSQLCEVRLIFPISNKSFFFSC